MKNLFLLSLFLLTAACERVDADQYEAWKGKWTGPEGTSLEINRGVDGIYTASVQSLDGLAIYQARPVAGGLAIDREDKRFVIHAGTGEETGMKWLLDKQNCLIIQTGEDFCR